MASISVHFIYATGLKRDVFKSARLLGSWDANGQYSDAWTTVPMNKITHIDGCTAFEATVKLDSSQTGWKFYYGMSLVRNSDGTEVWGIINHADGSDERKRTFVLTKECGDQIYYLHNYRRLGANKYYPDGKSPAVRFGVWAPNAEDVEVVFGSVKSGGYICYNGDGIDKSMKTLPMTRQEDGVWYTDATDDYLKDFSTFDHKWYMYQIKKKGGRVVYRTDLYSRCQIGSGDFDPKGDTYSQGIERLDGSVSCSVVIDDGTVVGSFDEAWKPKPRGFIPAEDFWKGDDENRKRLPKRVEDIVIYELHTGALGFGKKEIKHDANNQINIPGDIRDAMGMLDYLADLNVNCIELLPMSEFEGWASWGYGTSHYFAIEYSEGGRDEMKHFVRECHKRGIAVIMDVVYNHYDHNAERAEWMYDSDAHEENIYYWYEGRPSDYIIPEGGYIDNMSTGYSPRFCDEMVRNMFISSAINLMEEFHIDGFRLDQTTSMHSYNCLHVDGRSMGNVNVSGARFLTEFNTALKMINPDVIVTAEDHSGWDRVVMPLQYGGIGFDAAWYAEFYHNLTGTSGNRPQNSRLIKLAGYGGNDPLHMDWFAGSLGHAGSGCVVYHISHDEAGNAENSARTIVAASNYALLFGDTRVYAEARCRFAFGMAMLSPGTPMFLFGEEVGAFHSYTYNNFVNNKDDLKGLRGSDGQYLFRFYSDLIAFRRANGGIRSRNIDIVHVHDANRVIAFRRWSDEGEYLVVGSLNNAPFGNGYHIDNILSGDGAWHEVFNSDASIYRGHNVGNAGGYIRSYRGGITVIIPANGVIVLRKA